MTLEEVRVNIDRVDQQIKLLFQERMALSEQVAQVKAETGDQILKPERENAIIERLTEDSDPRIRREYTALIRRIMEVSRMYQYGRTLQLRRCFDVTWCDSEKKLSSATVLRSQTGLCSMLPPDIMIPVDSFEEAGNLIASHAADGGCGILESVGVGPENDIHSMLVEHHLFINRCETIEDGCSHKKIVLFTDRLVVLPEHNRLKIMFVCKNSAGSLARILTMIADYGLNLTEIHSRPDRQSVWNYRFFAELEGNLLNDEMQALVFQLENETDYFQILGSYYCKV